jgi:hypothetical protein
MPPQNPYAKADWVLGGLTAERKRARTAVLDADELAIVQGFFDQLCALVEGQRISDPLCLMAVHKARACCVLQC